MHEDNNWKLIRKEACRRTNDASLCKQNKLDCSKRSFQERPWKRNKPEADKPKLYSVKQTKQTQTHHLEWTSQNIPLKIKASLHSIVSSHHDDIVSELKSTYKTSKILQLSAETLQSFDEREQHPEQLSNLQKVYNVSFNSLPPFPLSISDLNFK